ncbi:hypothetical protein B5M09_005858 [Aphanomyces astaci]|uniref:Uncharacterized protein n=1 Tax=Aphanomyces astaci TaxID=112090 RepID=A0A3R8D8G9_APHAT|nr:hypothetical protein B5M09_005858 [Aphanomyces astaci]
MDCNRWDMVVSLVRADPELIVVLLQLCITDDEGNSIAHVACRCKRPFPLEPLRLALEGLLTTVNMDGQSPIHVAASCGNLHALQCAMTLSLSQAAQHCTLVDRAGNLPLHAAVAERHWHVVVPLVTWHPPAAASPDPLGDLAVHIAASCRQWDVVEAIIALAPHTVTIPDRLGRSLLRLALHGAAWSVATTLLDLLVDTPLPPDVESVDPAVEQAQWHVAGQLLAKGVPVPQPLATMKLACQLGAPSVVLAALVASYSYPTDEVRDTRDKKLNDGDWATMALDVALRHRQWEVAKWVLAMDASAARRKNRMRLLPLQVAAATDPSNAPPVSLLNRLAAAYPQAAVAVDCSGTPLLHILCHRHHWTCVQALVQAAPTVATLAPAEVVVDLAIAGPYTTSVVNRSTWILHDILTKYALSLSGASDVPRLAAAFASCSDANQNTALHVGIACGHVGFCSTLVRDHGVDVFAVNLEGESALDLARRSPDPGVRAVFATMDVTVSSSSPPPSPWIEAVDGHGRTPLMHAALAGHWAAVQWMLQHGADPATIQALDLPRTVQRAVAASQHAHVVIHRRYVVQTIIGPQQERHDDEVGEGLAMDLKTGHNIRPSKVCRYSLPWHGRPRMTGAAVWTVQYDDGDSEDMTQADLAAIVGVKRSIQGYVATTQLLSQGHSVWLVHDLQLVSPTPSTVIPNTHSLVDHRSLEGEYTLVHLHT